MPGRAGATPAPTPRARQTQAGSAGRPLPPGMARSSCSLLAVPSRLWQRMRSRQGRDLTSSTPDVRRDESI